MEEFENFENLLFPFEQDASDEEDSVDLLVAVTGGTRKIISLLLKWQQVGILHQRTLKLELREM
jgi:hypothetical protein